MCVATEFLQVVQGGASDQCSSYVFVCVDTEFLQGVQGGAGDQCSS